MVFSEQALGTLCVPRAVAYPPHLDLHNEMLMNASIQRISLCKSSLALNGNHILPHNHCFFQDVFQLI